MTPLPSHLLRQDWDSGTPSTSPSATALDKLDKLAGVDPVSLMHPKDFQAQTGLSTGPVGSPCLALLPTWISFWLGYRGAPPPPVKNYIVWIWSFIGAFSCISIIQALFGKVPYFLEKGVPSIGATAILLYGGIESPLCQPRPVLLGHVVGATTGVCITKLFELLPTEERYNELSWLAGSLCCALSLVFMQMTGTMHPPAGATALMAPVSPEIRKIGWLYIPVVLLAASIALVVALITNNMQRRYPIFWWTPPPTVAPSFTPTRESNRTLTRTSTWMSVSTAFEQEQHIQRPHQAVTSIAERQMSGFTDKGETRSEGIGAEQATSGFALRRNDTGDGSV